MRDLPSIAYVIHVYRKPAQLARLLENIEWAGKPDVPFYIFEDPSPYSDRDEINDAYRKVCREFKVPLVTADTWGQMQGISEFAMQVTHEDWILWTPDDVLFTRGALWNEVGGVLNYGREFIGGIQFPYWNAHDLMTKGYIEDKDCMLNGWKPEDIPQNPFWNDKGLPRTYLNFNGAGFAIARRLWKEMGGYPQKTSRLDEVAGFFAWKLGMPIITLPGPPRVHYFGGSGNLTPSNPSDLATYEECLGMQIGPATDFMYAQRRKIPFKGGDEIEWNTVLDFFAKGGSLV